MDVFSIETSIERVRAIFEAPTRICKIIHNVAFNEAITQSLNSSIGSIKIELKEQHDNNSSIDCTEQGLCSRV